ncbi:MAG: MOSC domain-containing protein [Salinisphaera sp.]|nr:MOSC domain-containing protein [Salinisphaera sp.]
MDGRRSAVSKRAVDNARWVGQHGVEGDEQADQQCHGGLNRALLHYPVEHYAFLAQTLSGTEIDIPGLRAGAFGENISTRGLTENDVHVGDIFAIGEATVQITQPRRPCWKLGAHLGYKPLAGELIATARAGWLYRVIEPGYARTGDQIRRIETADHGISIAALWACHNAPAPNEKQRAQLAFLTEYPGLMEDWRQRLALRLAG